jgi:peptidoglycan/LPS O-acetylase OafA/YrhL
MLRFCAALAVLAYHYVSCYLPAHSMPDWLAPLSLVSRYGYLGVDLFFAISGFVIVWSAVGISPSAFLSSRISRLFPSFWVALLLTSATVMIFGSQVPELQLPLIDLSRVFANATMMPDLFGEKRIDDVYWTLEVELRFYFLVFLMLIFRQVHRIDGWLAAWVAVSVLGQIIELPWLVGYLALDPYGPLFICGCLIYLAAMSGWNTRRTVVFGASVLLALRHSLESRGGFITPNAVSDWIVPVVVFASIAAVVSASRVNLNPPLARIACALGALTYPLYLTHAMIGRISITYLEPRIGAVWALCVTTTTAFGIAKLLVYAVDVPARRPVRRLVDRALQYADQFVRRAVGRRMKCDEYARTRD